MSDATREAEARERTPQDYAIKFGEYMAKAAERYVVFMGGRAKIPTCDFDECADLGHAVESAIYEFRKRASAAFIEPVTPDWTPRKVIERIAQVANAIGLQAGVGASETAGTIISVLAANPFLIGEFLEKGAGIFIDGDTGLTAENGNLSFYSKAGEILTPEELVRRKVGKATS